MDDALRWPWIGARRADRDTTAAGTTARFGGDDSDEPILIAVIHGMIPLDMAEAALQDAQIPALIKRNSFESLYVGISSGISGEVWVPPAFAESARDLLVGIGVIEG